jgi:hypothetical protein
VLIGIKSDACRAVELTDAIPFVAPLAQEVPLLIEDGNPVQGLIGDVNAVVGINGDRRRPHELPIVGATGAELAQVILRQRTHRHPLIVHAEFGFRAAPI